MHDLGLFASPKWELIKEVATSSQSPTSLAKKLHTSIPNVLHHLKLLEAYGIITGKPSKMKKTGKPPTLYGLAKPLAFIVLLDKIGSAKKTFYPNTKERFFLQCMFNLKEPENMAFMKLGIEHPELLDEYNTIGIKDSSSKSANLLVICQDVSIYRNQKSKITVKTEKGDHTFTIWSHTREEFIEGIRKKEDYFIKFRGIRVLHDPKEFIKSLEINQ